MGTGDGICTWPKKHNTNRFCATLRIGGEFLEFMTARVVQEELLRIAQLGSFFATLYIF